MNKKEKEDKIIHLLGLAECKLYKLLPSNEERKISDEAFSVVTYFDDIRKILRPKAKIFLSSTDHEGHCKPDGLASGMWLSDLIE